MFRFRSACTPPLAKGLPHCVPIAWIFFCVRVTCRDCVRVCACMATRELSIAYLGAGPGGPAGGGPSARPVGT